MFLLLYSQLLLPTSGKNCIKKNVSTFNLHVIFVNHNPFIALAVCVVAVKYQSRIPAMSKNFIKNFKHNFEFSAKAYAYVLHCNETKLSSTMTLFVIDFARLPLNG